MKSLKSLKLIAPFALLSLLAAACGPDPLVGSWTGKTSGCLLPEHDGQDVTVVVLEDRTASALTALGVDTSAGEAVPCSGGAVALDDADVDLAFTSVRTCGDDEIEVRLNLATDGLDTQSGRLAVLVDGAAFATCDLTVSR